MKKVIKIGFPILCVGVIAGTFILLNRTTDRISRNRLVEDDHNIVVNTTPYRPVTNAVPVVENTLSEEEIKAQEVKAKARAIELVKKFTPPTTNTYYTNEGMVENKYLVAVRDNTTKNATIYYTVDINSEKVEIYEK